MENCPTTYQYWIVIVLGIVQIFIPFNSNSTTYNAHPWRYRYYANSKWYDMTNITQMGPKFTSHVLNYGTITLPVSDSAKRVSGTKNLIIPSGNVLIGQLHFNDFTPGTKGWVNLSYTDLNDLNYNTLFIDPTNGNFHFKMPLYYTNKSSSDKNLPLWGKFQWATSSAPFAPQCGGFAEYLLIDLNNTPS